MNSDNFLIEERDLEFAQNICKPISDISKRNKAVANVTAANIAAKFFDGSKYKIDTSSGLHNIAAVLEELDISDIYLDGCYIDVRLYFNEQEISVPKEHFDRHLLPAAYMFIKINDDLSGGSVTGFILPENVNTNTEKDGNYPVEYSSLVSFYDIESRLISSDDTFDIDSTQIFAYLDGRLDDKNKFLSSLIASENGRLRLARAAKAKYIFNFVSVPEPLQRNEEPLEVQDRLFTDVFSSTDSADEADNNQDVVLEDDLALTSFDYSTVTSPSIETLEEQAEKSDKEVPEALDTLTEEDLEISIPDEEEAPDEKPAEEIDSLFGKENTDGDVSTESENNEYSAAGVVEDFRPKKKNAPVLLIAALLIAVLGAAGYIGYSRLGSQTEDLQTNLVTEPVIPDSVQPQQDAMPVETVETVKPKTSQEEGNAVSIPAIEQNLDASILVSNLKTFWEVPEGYASNTSAQRYLNKLGKIIQLNLKTELLLLSKPPITNKIAVEIKYNKESRKFEAVGIVTSSGEKSVDDLILQTVSKALAMNLSANTDSFKKLQGNPVFIIQL